jgi:hypothetical protein
VLFVLIFNYHLKLNIMTTALKQNIVWLLTGLVGVLFLYSSLTKILGDPKTLQIGLNFGLNNTTFKIIGTIELLSIILFLVPRTSLLGTMLLIAYMGGAIASHLEHQESIWSAVFIQSFIWLTAFVKFPEVRNRILRREVKQ